jgi:hypothetical protein
MWTRENLPYAYALIPMLLWIWLGAPLLLRPFGVSIPLNPLRKRKLRWNLLQSMLWGALAWGLGMSFFGLTATYCSWKLSGIPSDQPTLAGFGALIIKWTVLGLFVGLFTGLLNGKQSGDQPNPDS